MTATADHRRASRGAWSFALLISGAVLALVTTVNTWVERQALDTDAWVDATDRLLADPDIREALSVYLVDELYQSIDVGGSIADLLPADFDRLGGIVAAALREPATDAVARVLETDAVREAWRQANRLAHESLLAVIEDDTGDVLSTAGGAVSIDLGELVRAVGERVGLGDEILDRLGEDAGVLVLFESDELELAQDAAHAVKRLSAFLFVLVVGLFAAAVHLSSDRRRAVRDVGIALAAVGVLVMLSRLVGVDALANSLSQASDDEPAVSILDIGSSLLRQIAITELLIGGALMIFAFLAGPAQLARQVRGFVTPVLRHGPVAAVAGGFAVYLVLLWIRPGGPIDAWLVAVTLAALCVAGVLWIQRVALAEAA